MRASVSPVLLDRIREALERTERWGGFTDWHGEVRLELERGVLKGLGSGDLAFLEPYVAKFVREGRFVLRPRSLRDFITRERYRDSDVAVFYIPLLVLRHTGLLYTRRRGGLVWWMLGSVELDPLRYPSLYRLTPETARTLLHELGYLDVVERYGARVHTNPTEHRDTLATLELPDLTVEFQMSRVVARYRRGPVNVEFTVSKPSPDIVERLREYGAYTALIVGELVDNLGRWLREIGVEAEPIYPHARVEDFRLEEVEIEFYAESRTGRLGRSVRLYYTFRRGTTLEHHLHICIRADITSRYLQGALKVVEGLDELLPPGYSVNLSSPIVTVSFETTLEHTPTPPPSVERHYTLISNIEEVLRRVLDEYMEDTGLKKLLNWRSGQDLDTIKLKIVAYTHLCGTRECEGLPPVDVLVAYALLEGHSQEVVAEAVNKPLEVLAKLVASRKLWIDVGTLKLQFKGRSLTEELPQVPPTLEHEILTLISLAMARRELEEARRKLKQQC